MDKMIKKTKRNKIFTILTTVLVAMALTITSIGAAVNNDSKGTITINGVDANDTVKVYKIIDVNFTTDTEGQPTDPIYTWTTEAAALLTGDYAKYMKEVNGKKAVVDFAGIDAKDEKALLEYLAKGTLGTAVDAVKTETGTFTASELAMGEYLIVVTKAEGSDKAYQVTSAKLVPTYDSTNGWTLANATVNVKNDGGVPEKKIDSATDDTVKVGDKRKYTISLDIPSYGDVAPAEAKITIGDTLGSGLDYELTGDKFVPEVKAGDNALAATDYTVTWNSADARKFTVEVHTETVLAHQGEKLSVSYNAIVNESAFAVDSLTNKATINLKRDPYSDYEDRFVEEKLYTYGIEFVKLDTEKNIALKNAEFELKQGEAKLGFKLVDGVYVYSTAQGATTTLVSDANGNIKVHGLDLGEYVLKETKAPAGGYTLPNVEFTINLVDDDETKGTLDTVKKDENDTATSISNPGDKYFGSNKGTVTNNIYSFELNNSTDTDFTLPNTGGVGTLAFTVGGMLLMAGAVVFLTLSKKRA